MPTRAERVAKMRAQRQRRRTWTRRVLVAPFALISPVIAARCVWHWRPSIVSAALLLVVYLGNAFDVMARRSDWHAFALATVGGVMNLAVILRNRGRMPVVGLKPDPESKSVWVGATREHRWLPLADQMRWFGFSVGDAVIALGLLVSFLY